MARPLRRGAVAMLDILGTKGIEKRVGGHYEAVLDRLLQQANDATREFVDKTGMLLGANDKPAGVFEFTQALFLSDTIVILVAAKSPERIQKDLGFPVTQVVVDAGAARVACDVVHRVLYAAASDPVLPLAYRGCVSFGEFMTEDNFIIGPAVWEAGAGMDAAEGAFAWLTPPARGAVEGVAPTGSLLEAPRFPLVSYEVPMGEGRTTRTLVVSPVPAVASLRRRARGHMLESFDGGGERVQLLRQTTERFLDELDRITRPSEP